MFGAGGGTSSYEETRAADLILLWGSNAREAHPIFFHHVLKAVNDGAKLMVVDPRRTPSAQWADLWLGLDVGTDIPLANAVGREIIEAGLADMEFVERATTGGRYVSRCAGDPRRSVAAVLRVDGVRLAAKARARRGGGDG